MNTFVKIIRNGHMAPGKLADAELHFTGGELDGLRLIGFSIWARKDGTGQNVTFPARQFTTNGQRRSFLMLRAITRSRLLRTVCGTSSCRRIARTNSSSRRLPRREPGRPRGRLRWQLQRQLSSSPVSLPAARRAERTSCSGCGRECADSLWPGGSVRLAAAIADSSRTPSAGRRPLWRADKTSRCSDPSF